LAAGHETGSYPSTPIAAYRGFEVTVRPASGGTVRLGLRRPDRSDALEYATVRTLDLDQVSAYGTGLFQRLEHLLDALAAELKAAQDGLAREETNRASYTEQLARPFEHEQAPYGRARAGTHRAEAHQWSQRAAQQFEARRRSGCLTSEAAKTSFDGAVR
jgi:hypothetical protein